MKVSAFVQVMRRGACPVRLAFNDLFLEAALLGSDSCRWI